VEFSLKYDCRTWWVKGWVAWKKRSDEGIEWPLGAPKMLGKYAWVPKCFQAIYRLGKKWCEQ